MLPTVDPVYSVAKGAFWPWLRWGLHWKVEGAHHIPQSGPALIASNHVSYLDPLTLAWVADGRGRHVRFLAKAELFDKKGLGTLLHAAHQIPVQRGKVDAADALQAAVDALGQGECVAVFPEGTISQDLEPMAGILTLESGNVLSHSQLLAANLGPDGLIALALDRSAARPGVNRD